MISLEMLSGCVFVVVVVAPYPVFGPAPAAVSQAVSQQKAVASRR